MIKLYSFDRDFNVSIGDTKIVKTLKANEFYLIEESSIRDGKFVDISVVCTKEWNFNNSYDISIDGNDKKILLQRSGGIGDCSWVTVVSRQIKKMYPKSHIYIGCGGLFKFVFNNNKDIDGVVLTPISETEFKQFDYMLSFEGTVEKSKDLTK